MPLLIFGAAELDKFCFAKFWTRTVLAKDSENEEGHRRALMGPAYTVAAHPALLCAILKQALIQAKRLLALTVAAIDGAALCQSALAQL